MTETDQEFARLRRGPDHEEEALQWFVRMTSGEATVDDKVAFARWRAQPGNSAAYAELEGIWGGIGELFQGTANNVIALPRRKRWSDNWGQKAAAIAACITVFGLAGQQYATMWQYDSATQGSARGHEELADGSTIDLNTGSALDVDYGADARCVTLARGEAFFDVKRDPSKPFIIKAGSGDVRVLGTAFSVKREGDGARVTVIRGKVRVSAAGGKYVDITPNQQVRFAGAELGAVRSVDADTQLAWSKGRLVLRNRPLGEVIDEIDRYYPGAIILNNDAAAKKRVDAVVDLNRIDDWLEALTRSQGVTVRSLPGVVYLS